MALDSLDPGVFKEQEVLERLPPKMQKDLRTPLRDMHNSIFCVEIRRNTDYV